MESYKNTVAPTAPSTGEISKLRRGGPSVSRSRHMVQLDGLRFLAVAAVAWYHWMPLRSYGVQWGPLGVQLFFVLSGFLITGILLDARAGSEIRGEKWFSLRQFYIRRFLRIFPLFYLTLAVGVVVNVPQVRETWLWHATYTSNIYFFLRGSWNGHVGHFWSLAVEEQFYLFWPFLILFVRRRFVPWMICAAIGFAPLFRAVVPLFYADNDFAHCLTPGCFDSLGVGAFLAYLVRNPHFWRPDRCAKMLLAVGLPGCLITYGFHLLPKLDQTFAAFCFGWLVYTAANGFGGAFGSLLQAGPIVYLGRISYGIYVLHMFAIDALELLIRQLHLPAAIMDHGLLRAPILAVLTIGIASVSWYLYEKPLNDLKRLWPYSRESSKARVIVAS
jgi:peptidoglycan/LPS O-acetylase OafA/YrhL